MGQTNNNMSTMYSVLIVALSLSSLVLSGDYGMDKDDNHWPTKRVHTNTPRPTKWSPPSYNPKPTWKKPSYPKWKKTSKPTWQKNDHESYEKEAVSHIYNPYDIRQRGIVKAQLEERIESDM